MTHPPVGEFDGVQQLIEDYVCYRRYSDGDCRTDWIYVFSDVLHDWIVIGPFSFLI